MDNLTFDIIGVDGGTYNFKTSRNEFICRGVYSTNTRFNINNKGILELNGKRYQMGVGKFDAEIIKSKRDNLPLFLYSIAMSTQSENVKIVTGIPHYQLEKDEYVAEQKSKLIGEFKFKLNGEDRRLNILDAILLPEGVGAYYTVTENLSDKDAIFIDFGGSTIHVIHFRNGELIKIKTITKGSLNLLTDMLQYVNTEYGGRHNIDMVADYIRRGRIGKKECNLVKETVELSQPYMDELLTLLELEFPKDVAEYYITGGGVEVFSESVIQNLGDVGLIRDYMFANANGFEIAGGVIFGG